MAANNNEGFQGDGCFVPVPLQVELEIEDVALADKPFRAFDNASAKKRQKPNDDAVMQAADYTDTPIPANYNQVLNQTLARQQMGMDSDEAAATADKGAKKPAKIKPQFHMLDSPHAATNNAPIIAANEAIAAWYKQAYPQYEMFQLAPVPAIMPIRCREREITDEKILYYPFIWANDQKPGYRMTNVGLNYLFTPGRRFSLKVQPYYVYVAFKNMTINVCWEATHLLPQAEQTIMEHFPFKASLPAAPQPSI